MSGDQHEGDTVWHKLCISLYVEIKNPEENLTWNGAICEVTSLYMWTQSEIVG
jgi:hypothetical protein